MSESYQEQINNLVGAAHGDFKTVKEILTAHPELINSDAVWVETPIQAAAQMGRVDIVEYLLAAGAPMDICTAAMLGKGDYVRAQIEADPAQALATGAHGLPLVYFPVIMGYQDIADFVLQHGGRVNDGEGATPPLHGAVEHNQLKIAGWLLQHGANVNALNYESKTPLAKALQNKNQAMADLLAAHGGKA